MNPTILSPTLRSILAKIEAENREDPVWIVGPETGQLLFFLIRVVQPEHILEIGSSVGYSGLWMAAALEANDKGRLTTIESHKERFGRAQNHFEHSGLAHRILSLKAHAPEIFTEPERFGYAVQVIPENIDLAFFDATKKQHDDFLDVILPRLSSNAYLVVDNVSSHQEELSAFLVRLQNDPRFLLTQVGVGQGLLIARYLG